MTDQNTPAWMGSQSGHNAQEFTESYPLIQWMNGDKKLKQIGGVQAFGGFIFKFDQDPEWPVGKMIDFTYSSGDVEQVFEMGEDVEMVVIASRLDWYFKTERGGKERKEFLPEYTDGAKARNRWLVFVKGAEEWHKINGPVMLSMYGVNGFMMARDVIQSFGKLRNKLGSIYKTKLDDYTFNMPTAPGPSQKANPDHPTLITPPTLNIPDEFENEQAMIAWFGGQYIGDDMMKVAAKYWDECQEWAQLPIDAPAVDRDGPVKGNTWTEGAAPDETYNPDERPDVDEDGDIPF